MATTKVCKICGIDKPIEDFRVNLRTCKKCQLEKNKMYMKNYYETHRERLITENKQNYYKKNLVRNPNGRPKKHFVECEIEKVLSC